VPDVANGERREAYEQLDGSYRNEHDGKASEGAVVGAHPLAANANSVILSFEL
jgi:hypothetical protein